VSLLLLLLLLLLLRLLLLLDEHTGTKMSAHTRRLSRKGAHAHG
jgi:hypothetical protein